MKEKVEKPSWAEIPANLGKPELYTARGRAYPPHLLLLASRRSEAASPAGRRGAARLGGPRCPSSGGLIHRSPSWTGIASLGGPGLP